MNEDTSEAAAAAVAAERGVAAAPNNNSSNTNKGVNAFEWLAGGLFFGGDSKKNSSRRELQSIESSKDIKQLWTGVQDNWQQILLQHQQQQQPTEQISSADSDDVIMQEETEEVTAATTTAATNAASDTASSAATAAPNDRDFLSARLLRLRFLLYEERKQTLAYYTSQSNNSNPPLFGVAKKQPSVAMATANVFAAQAQNNDDSMWLSMIRQMALLPFESRKVMAHIFCYLTVSGLDGPDADLYRESVMHVFLQHVLIPQFNILTATLVSGYSLTPPLHNNSNNTSNTSSNTAVSPPSSDIALHCGSMFRAMIRHAIFYQKLVGTSEAVAQFVFPFLDTYVHSPNFDVASDAMESLKCVFIPQSPTDSAAAEQMAQDAAEFMTRDYTAIWEDRFVPKLLYANEAANNYMTKRMALQILSTLLLTRTNYNVMVRFVASARNCKVILLLLRHTSPHITLDAFHVFKVFVANPHKPLEVVKMLKDNQIKLSTYLQGLHAEKAQNDAQFRDEKALIIATIQAL